MRRYLALFGFVLVGIGAYQGYTTYDFVSHTFKAEATVEAVEPLPGPPKPRSRIPLHVRFTTPSGEERRTQIRMPLLQKIQQGDTVPIIVDSRNPQEARLPLASELWSVAAAFVAAGLGALLIARFAPQQSPQPSR